MTDVTELAMTGASQPRMEAFDPARGSRRIATLKEGRLVAVLFVTVDGVLPSRDWLIAQLSAPAVAG